ncbi:MAG: ribokinase [Lactovum sp.]
MSKIIIVGSIAMDLVLETNKIPEQGETVVGESFSTFAGGKGANQAVAAARLTDADTEVLMVGAVGQDDFASQLKENLKKENINIKNVGTVSGSTGIAQITLFEKDNRIIIIPAANNKVEIDDFSIFDKADIVVLQNEIPHYVNLQIVNYCQEKKIKVLYNPAPSRETDHEMLDMVDFISPNEHECCQLFPDLTIEEALRKYPNKLIVTQGVSGVSYCDSFEIKKIPAIKAEVVDTTGAGDTFNAAFAVALIQSLPIEEAIKFAVLAAHLSVQKLGAQLGMPTLKEMEVNKNYEKNWNFK